MQLRGTVLAVAIGVVAMGWLGPAAHAAELAVVKVGIQGLISDVGMFVAMEKGYFQDEGIRVDFERFGSGGKMVPALVAGEIEVAGGTASAGLYNAIAAGVDFKIVADKAQNRPGHEFNLLVIRKDLMDSGAVRSLADLKGRKIAHFPGQGVVSQYLLAQILEHAGIPWGGVDRVEMAPANQVTMLATNQVAAIVTAEPFGARAERAGGGVRYAVTGEVKALERLQSSVFIYSGRFIAARRDVARRWINGYVRALRFVHEKGLKSPEVVGLLSKHTRVSADDLLASWPPYFSPDGRPDVASLAAQQDWYARMGMVQTKVPMEKIVDLSFLQ